MSSVKKIDDVLDTLENAIPSVIGTIVASGDGFVITDTLNGTEAEEVAAMVATTTSVSERMSSTFSAGGVKETSIRSEDRSIFLYRASKEGILAVIAEDDANVGMIHLRARDTAQAIGNYLTTPTPA
jgi:predicted regulator of Ras-like GTPase activity (Roadblock/LC7/MglB family)